MKSNWSRGWSVLLGGILFLCVVAFPRVLAFIALASREIRYFWWLILLFALGVWLAFFFGRKRH